MTSSGPKRKVDPPELPESRDMELDRQEPPCATGSLRFGEDGGEISPATERKVTEASIGMTHGSFALRGLAIGGKKCGNSTH